MGGADHIFIYIYILCLSLYILYLFIYIYNYMESIPRVQLEVYDDLSLEPAKDWIPFLAVSLKDKKPQRLFQKDCGMGMFPKVISLGWIPQQGNASKSFQIFQCERCSN